MKVMYNCFFSSLFLGEGSVDLEIFLFYISLRFTEKRWIRLIFACVFSLHLLSLMIFDRILTDLWNENIHNNYRERLKFSFR